MSAGAKESAEWERTLKVFRRINIGDLELQNYSRKQSIVKFIRLFFYLIGSTFYIGFTNCQHLHLEIVQFFSVS